MTNRMPAKESGLKEIKFAAEGLVASREELNLGISSQLNKLVN